METSTFDLHCVGLSDERLRAAAHQVAVVGRPIIGRPSTEATKFANDPNLVILLAVRRGDDTPVGVVTWKCPGPSRRIPSGYVTSMAVGHTLDGRETAEAVFTMAKGVPIQFEYVLGRLASISSGYVVVDVPRVAPFGKVFTSAGWLGLQAPDSASSTRHVAFVYTTPSSSEAPNADSQDQNTTD